MKRFCIMIMLVLMTVSMDIGFGIWVFTDIEYKLWAWLCLAPLIMLFIGAEVVILNGVNELLKTDSIL